MPRTNAEPVGIAIFARAPVAGQTKTRLIPALGASGAARLHRQMIVSALAVSRAAAVGPVVVWAAPDAGQRFFRALSRRGQVGVCAQPAGDLGERMAAAFAGQRGPMLLIGSDCPALRPAHLVSAAALLGEATGNDAVLIPAEDGGYVLIGLRHPEPAVFVGIDWGSARVMAQTRQRLSEHGLRWAELPELWDVDRAADLARLAELDGSGPWLR